MPRGYGLTASQTGPQGQSGAPGQGPHRKEGPSIGAAVPKARRGRLSPPRRAKRLALLLPWGTVFPEGHVVRRARAADRQHESGHVLRTHNVPSGNEWGQVSRSRDRHEALPRGATMSRRLERGGAPQGACRFGKVPCERRGFLVGAAGAAPTGAEGREARVVAKPRQEAEGRLPERDRRSRLDSRKTLTSVRFLPLFLLTVHVVGPLIFWIYPRFDSS